MMPVSVNRLGSLEGLCQCSDLVWLSIKDNALTTLQGIQGLASLTDVNLDINQVRYHSPSSYCYL